MPETLNMIGRELIGVSPSEQNETSISDILNLIHEDIGTKYRTMIGNHETNLTSHVSIFPPAFDSMQKIYEEKSLPYDHPDIQIHTFLSS